MGVRIGINGFGRIGRNFLRSVLDLEKVSGREAGAARDLDVVAINDLVSLEVNAHLLRYDSTFGRLGVEVSQTEKGLRVGDREITVFEERDPKAIGWGDLSVDVVIESTGRFTTRESAMAHIEAGAKRVIISAPSKDADATFVVGVNDDAFDPDRHLVVSNASCTTNCLVPMVKVLDDAFGVRQGLMTTVHAYTNDQTVLDLGRDNLRRARAAAVNIIPSTTGAARATSLVLEAMKGRLDGQSLRVPVQDGSITDLTALLGARVAVDEINAAFRAASKTERLRGIIEYNEDEIVSTDIVGSPASCTFDSTLTMAIAVDEATTLAKVMGWYDNEWGFSN
ncbi:MAG TPA: type I glyceraldehyde-3-phosphate dehydrogenase, partial [Acidimicrobiales bacterium]|nr:type I glyceraldehyde-3-phosphate dehydrogenase [Acidimicrobiales bacterium]